MYDIEVFPRDTMIIIKKEFGRPYGSLLGEIRSATYKLKKEVPVFYPEKLTIRMNLETMHNISLEKNALIKNEMTFIRLDGYEVVIDGLMSDDVVCIRYEQEGFLYRNPYTGMLTQPHVTGLCKLQSKTTEIKKVIFNDPATIVYWTDGSRTVVKCQEGDTFDKEKGLAMAIVKRLKGDKGNYNDIFEKWCK